jgi:hypothetical protein
MRLLGIADLCVRWSYSKAGVHKLAKSKDFPSPIGIVCKGRIKIFLEEDILSYERTRPWLFDEEQKIRRQKLYAKLQHAKEFPNPEIILKRLFGERATTWKSS